MNLLTLTTDFGTTDYYVAAVRGVLSRLAPHARLLDVSHELPPGDVEEAAFILWAAARWYPAGSVHLAVVDPGVGSSRRILAVRSGGSFFVAPDNGLLTPLFDGAPGSYEALRPDVLERGGGTGTGASRGASPSSTTAALVRAPLSVRAVERTGLFLPGPGSTFHGRDRFAPVAAFLARGEPLAELGPEIDDPVRLPVEPPRAEGDPPHPGAAGAVLRGRVVHVDRFGNLVTDVPVSWLGDGDGEPVPCRVEVEGHTITERARHYSAIPGGKAAILPGSLDTLELSLAGESLAARWELKSGTRVTVRVLPHSGG